MNENNPLSLQQRRPLYQIGVDTVRWGFAESIKTANQRARETGVRQLVSCAYTREQIAEFGSALRRAYCIQSAR